MVADAADRVYQGNIPGIYSIICPTLDACLQEGAIDPGSRFSATRLPKNPTINAQTGAREQTSVWNRCKPCDKVDSRVTRHVAQERSDDCIYIYE